MGNYQLLEKLGHGGMGVVYKARQDGLDRVVAIKTLLYGRWTNDRFIERFRAEARAAASLNHPGIVGIHEVGEQDGQPWFSMDFVPGPSLDRLVEEHPLPPRRGAALVKSVAEAIAHAHANGVLHRDLKPSNILLDASGNPRVTDFGLAKDIRSTAAKTLSGETLGSPHYLPPEQIGGRPDAAKPAADIYALGAILYHMITGRPPFHAESLETTLLQVLERDPAPPRMLNSEVPSDLENICLKCLEKNPAGRYASAQLLAEDLGRFLDGLPVLARSHGALTKSWRWCQRKPLVAGLLCATTALLLLLSIGSPIALLRIQKERDTAASESLRAQRSEYASHMLLAQHDLEENHLRRVDELLSLHDPGPLGNPGRGTATAKTTKPDLRGWEWSHLRRESHGDFKRLIATNLPLNYRFLALSPDNRTLALSGNSNVVLIDTDTGNHRATLPSPGSFPLGIAFNRQGELVFQESSGHLRGWSLAPLREIGVLTNHSTPGIVRFSPDGRWLATAGSEQGIDLWDWPARRLVYKVDDASGWTYFRGFAFSPDNHFLAWANRAGDVIFYDLRERREVRRVTVFPGWDAPVCWLEFTPDGKALACSCIDRTLKLFEVESWKLLGMHTNSGGLARIVTFLPDDKTMVVNDDDMTLQVWNWRTWQKQYVLRGHRAVSPSMAISSDGLRAFTASSDGFTREWNLNTDPATQTHVDLGSRAHVNALAMDGSVVLSINSENHATLWNTESLKQIANVAMPDVHKPWFQEFNIVRGSNAIAYLDTLNQIRIWQPGSIDPGLALESSPVETFVVSADGEKIAAATRARELVIWNVTNSQQVARNPFQAHTNDLAWSLAIARDGQRVALGMKKGEVWLWDGSTTAPLRRIREKAAAGVLGLAFSPDGHWLAAATGGDGIWLWNLTTGAAHTRLDAFTQAVRCVAFSPDGSRLASGGADGSITIWEPQTGQQLLRRHGHQGRINSVSFSADGHRVISVSNDSFRVWRAGE